MTKDECVVLQFSHPRKQNTHFHCYYYKDEIVFETFQEGEFKEIKLSETCANVLDLFLTFRSIAELHNESRIRTDIPPERINPRHFDLLEFEENKKGLYYFRIKNLNNLRAVVGQLRIALHAKCSDGNYDDASEGFFFQKKKSKGSPYIWKPKVNTLNKSNIKDFYNIQLSKEDTESIENPSDNTESLFNLSDDPTLEKFNNRAMDLLAELARSYEERLLKQEEEIHKLNNYILTKPLIVSNEKNEPVEYINYLQSFSKKKETHAFLLNLSLQVNFIKHYPKIKKIFAIPLQYIFLHCLTYYFIKLREAGSKSKKPDRFAFYQKKDFPKHLENYTKTYEILHNFLERLIKEPDITLQSLVNLCQVGNFHFYTRDEDIKTLREKLSFSKHSKNIKTLKSSQYNIATSINYQIRSKTEETTLLLVRAGFLNGEGDKNFQYVGNMHLWGESTITVPFPAEPLGQVYFNSRTLGDFLIKARQKAKQFSEEKTPFHITRWIPLPSSMLDDKQIEHMKGSFQELIRFKLDEDNQK